MSHYGIFAISALSQALWQFLLLTKKANIPVKNVARFARNFVKENFWDIMGIFKQCVLGLYLCTYFVTAILPLNVRPRRESIRQQKAFLQPKTCFSYFFLQVLRSKAELRFGWTPMVEKWLCGNKCLKDPIFGWKVLYLYALQKNFKVAHLHEDLKKNTESQNLYLHTKNIN